MVHLVQLARWQQATDQRMFEVSAVRVAGTFSLDALTVVLKCRATGRQVTATHMISAGMSDGTIEELIRVAVAEALAKWAAGTFDGVRGVPGIANGVRGVSGIATDEEE